MVVVVFSIGMLATKLWALNALSVTAGKRKNGSEKKSDGQTTVTKFL